MLYCSILYFHNCVAIYVLYIIDPKFYHLLQHRFMRNTSYSVTSDIGDIYDGKAYKDSFDFFSDCYALSFFLNYDGASKFKSSNTQIWPVQLCINELPPSVRYIIIMYIHT